MSLHSFITGEPGELSIMIDRGLRMFDVRTEAIRLLHQHSPNFETAKPEIVSDLKEYAYEVAGIKVKQVTVWDNGTVDIDFGDVVN